MRTLMLGPLILEEVHVLTTQAKRGRAEQAYKHQTSVPESAPAQQLGFPGILLEALTFE